MTCWACGSKGVRKVSGEYCFCSAGLRLRRSDTKWIILITMVLSPLACALGVWLHLRK